MTESQVNRENSVEISGFSSSPLKRIEGTIKSEPEDFVVDEIPSELTRDPDGKYTALKIRLENWDTNRFVSFLARELHISRKRITYAGTKDKRGITTQYFTVNWDLHGARFSLKDCEILEEFRCNRMLRLGDLTGNRFLINMHMNSSEFPTVMEIYEEVMKMGGFPNFFGLQRFGELRTNTHKLGKMIIEGRIEDAVLRYIYDSEIDTEDYRMKFGETNDPCLALELFPKHLSFERSILGYLCSHGEIHEAFSVLPRNLSIMFVHAYQSFIFNRILSERLARFGILDRVLPGDVLYGIDGMFNSIKDNEIRENGFNTEKLQHLSSSDRVRPTALIPGYESTIPDGDEGEIESHVLEDEKVELEQFKIQNHPELSSKGERRIISAKPINFSIHEDGCMEFALGKGIYATSFLREFLKK